MTTAEIFALVQGASSTCSKFKDLEIRRLRILVDTIIHGVIQVIYGLCCRQPKYANFEKGKLSEMKISEG